MNIKLEMLKMRLSIIESRPDATKSLGVIKKLRRQIRNMEKEVG